MGLIWALFANDTHDFNAISGNFSKNFTPLFSSREIGGSLDLQGTTGLRKIFLEANKNSFTRIRNEQVVGSSPIASSSDFKASGDARGLFYCLELANS